MFRGTSGRAAIVLVVALIASAFAAMPASQAQAGNGDFHVLCSLAHVLPDDPIVRPGQPGASHLHDFFGNLTTDAFSTFGSMQGGGSSCNFGPDTAGYWVPALISPGGAVISPLHLTAYYFGQGTVTAPPPDLRMLAGGDTSNLNAAGYACGEGQPTSPIPMSCGGGLDMKGVITFPSCWDGSSTDSADHRSHMAYPNGMSCPPNYPVTIPKIVVHVTYGISDGTGYWLSSDANFNTTQGRSLHADFWNTWDQAALQAAVNDCINAGDSCNLGDGSAPPPSSSPDAPSVTSFSPTSGSVGSSVTVNGKRFTGATGVTFNGTTAVFTVSSNSRLTATVPNGATTGPIIVTNLSGQGVSPGQFRVATPPTVTSFSPSLGAVGASISLSGTSFMGATAVRFNNVSAPFVVNSSTTITATVPTGATSGRISVTTPSGSGNSASNFTVTGTGSMHERHVSLLLTGSLRAEGRVTVSDGFSGCESHVRVKLRWFAPGHGLAKGTWHTVGQARTGQQGRYHLRVHDHNGRYRARVKRTSSSTDPCSRATSRVKRHWN